MSFSGPYDHRRIIVVISRISKSGPASPPPLALPASPTSERPILPANEFGDETQQRPQEEARQKAHRKGEFAHLIFL